jgi:tetratricopeptide (TPR) repeat protein
MGDMKAEAQKESGSRPGMTSYRAKICLILAGILIAGASASAHAQDRTLLRAREGAAALMRGHYDRAVAFYDEALSAPEIADFVKASIYSDRGLAKWRMKQTKEAIDDFNQAIQLSPENATVYNNRGNALMDLGHPDEAIKDFDRAITLSANYGAAYNNRGNAHAALGQYKAAFHDFRKAVELMPESAVPFNGRGKAHSELKRYHAAVRDLNRAITLDTKYTAAYQNRAEANFAIGKYREVIEDASQAITLQGEQPAPELLLLRGRTLARDKKLNQALEDLNKAIELKSDLVDAYIERGAVFVQARRFGDAINDFSYAIQLDPQNVKAYTLRAEAMLQGGPSVVTLVTASGETTSGDTPSGETPSGETPSGETPSGGTASGETASGEIASGETASGETASGEITSGETASQGTSSEGTSSEGTSSEGTSEVTHSHVYAALNDVNHALGVAPDDPLALRVRGNVYEAFTRTSEAIADYRQALARDPFQTESREALVRLEQEVPPEPGRVLGEPVEDWVITEQSPGRFVASNPKYASLRAELEMFGAGEPRILEWKLLKDALSGIGLLKYYAGDFEDGGNSSLEYVAIVDTRANKVVSIEPHSWGSQPAQWNWQAVSVVVTAPDGNANEITLRQPRARPAQPRVARDFWGFEQPAPRQDRGGRRGRQGGGGGGGGMFDWLFR